MWDPAYWCEKCASPVRARDKWLFGAVFGPLMAIVGTFAMQAIPAGLPMAPWAVFTFATVCCAIVGWPLSRTLSRYLVYWEPREPSDFRGGELRRVRKDDE